MIVAVEMMLQRHGRLLCAGSAWDLLCETMIHPSRGERRDRKVTEALPDVEPYPSEFPKIKKVFERIQAEFANTPMTSTNQRLFEMAVSNQFGEIGFTTEI